jgi:hypothetical protein
LSTHAVLAAYAMILFLRVSYSTIIIFPFSSGSAHEISKMQICQRDRSTRHHSSVAEECSEEEQRLELLNPDVN